MTANGSRIKGPLRRFSAAESLAASELLTVWAAIGVFDDTTQRKAFLSLVPSIYVLRKQRRRTFKEISALCHRAGFRLTESTVRSYYSQFQPKLQKECDALLREVVSHQRTLQTESQRFSDD